MAAPSIVISFAAQDEPHAIQLRKHLAPLVQAGIVRTWHAGSAALRDGLPGMRQRE